MMMWLSLNTLSTKVGEGQTESFVRSEDVGIMPTPRYGGDGPGRTFKEIGVGNAD